MKGIIYYWEHARDESEYHRSTNARDIASIASHRQDAEIGVIYDSPDSLVLRPVAIAETRAKTETALTEAAKDIIIAHPTGKS